MDNFLKNIGNTLGNVANGVSHFVGQEVNQFSPAVQNFANQAQRALIQLPQQQQQIQQAQNQAIQQGLLNAQQTVKPFVQNVSNAMQGANPFTNPNFQAPQIPQVQNSNPNPFIRLGQDYLNTYIQSQNTQNQV